MRIIANTHRGQALLPTGTPTDPATGTPTPWGSPTPTYNPNNPDATAPPLPTDTPFPLLITTINGRFFYNPDNNSQNFNVTTATPPAFAEQFPVVAFDPRSDIELGCPHTANDSTRPFTDVIPGTPGTPCGQQPAQSL